MTRAIRAGALGLALMEGIAGLAPAQAQTQVDLKPAVGMLETDPARALAMANAVLAQNPNHIDALLIRARALSALGQPREARDAARRAYDISGEIRPARYASAMILAAVSSQHGNHLQSQFWLRRAFEEASSEVEAERVVQAYVSERRKSPWSFSLSAGAAPNSNVNNGSSSNIIVIAGLPFVLSPTAQALGGFTAEATGSVQYRVFETPRSQTFVGFEATGNMNWLNAASKAAAPGVSGHDFDYYGVTLIGTHTRILSGDGTRLSISAQAGRNWYGGTKLTDMFGAGAVMTFPVAGGRDRLELTARADRVLHARAALSDETIAKVGASYSHELAWGDRVSATVDYTRGFSTNVVQEFSKPAVSFEYAFGKPIAGAQFTLGASYEYKSFAVSPYTTSGRQDHVFGLELAADFKNISYMGFSPRLTVEAKRVRSNVSLYTQQSLTGGISIQSRF